MLYLYLLVSFELAVAAILLSADDGYKPFSAVLYWTAGTIGAYLLIHLYRAESAKLIHWPSDFLLGAGAVIVGSLSLLCAAGLTAGLSARLWRRINRR